MSRLIETVTAASGVLVRNDEKGGFDHLGTAWQVAPGEWLTAWSASNDPTGVSLLTTRDGVCTKVESWESADGLAGFKAQPVESVLSVRGGENLAKRTPLTAIGYPCLIDHPTFQLSRHSLNAERYVPYLCPWVISGHCALLTGERAWIAGTAYAGMEGSPVLTEEGTVVGLIAIDGVGGDENQPPLVGFRRISA